MAAPFRMLKGSVTYRIKVNFYQKLAPFQVVIVPIYRNEEQLALISEKVHALMVELKALGVSVKYDDSDNKKLQFGNLPNMS